MILKKTLAVSAMLLLITSAAVAAENNNSEMQSDLWLKAKLVTAYTLNEHLNPFTLDVEVKNGVAHLSGTVDSAIERDLAVEIAKGVKGIREVRENIKIEPGAMADQRHEPEFFRTVEDATITARVKSKLLWNRHTNGMDINVITEKGIVTLTGTVPSDIQGDLAVQLAKNTSGVEGVKWEFKVLPKGENAEPKGTIETIETKANDAWITTKVKSILLFSKEAEGTDIKVSTVDQVVTLQGAVETTDQRDAILKLVVDTIGVKEVRSLLKVEKE